MQVPLKSRAPWNLAIEQGRAFSEPGLTLKYPFPVLARYMKYEPTTAKVPLNMHRALFLQPTTNVELTLRREAAFGSDGAPDAFTAGPLHSAACFGASLIGRQAAKGSFLSGLRSSTGSWAWSTPFLGLQKSQPGFSCPKDSQALAGSKVKPAASPRPRREGGTLPARRRRRQTGFLSAAPRQAQDLPWQPCFTSRRQPPPSFLPSFLAPRGERRRRRRRQSGVFPRAPTRREEGPPPPAHWLRPTRRAQLEGA